MLLANSIARYAQWVFIGVMATSFLPPAPVQAQLPEIDLLSDEEAKQIQIAERFLSVLDKVEESEVMGGVLSKFS